MADSGGTLIVRGGGGGRRVAGEGVHAAGKPATHPAEEMEEGMEEYWRCSRYTENKNTAPRSEINNKKIKDR